MIDDVVEFAVAAAIDVEAEKAAKRHRWVRILRAIIGFLLIVTIAGLIYLMFKYS
ncbi:hypothetical protein [Pseudothauera rhizosphaerae]|uniref:hypothetical protein n=1 Tax=Pseudothauera rhizosphaerae TaxID=2565932 RepID=UPI001454E24C|nr:hypothetical protein [Pseudothauera rhizosphaerae]